MDKTLTALQRRLEEKELDHLRRHIGELHDKLMRAEAALQRARADAANAARCADFWQREAEQLQEALADESYGSARCIGLTRAGELLVVKDVPLAAAELDPYTLPLFPELAAHA